MLSVFLLLLVVISLIASGAMTGVFFAFSVAVMPGLDVIPHREAIRGMQSINRKILNPVFLVIFLLAGIAPFVSGILLFFRDEGWAGLVCVLAAAAYIGGAVVPTAKYNIPLNEGLDGIDVGSVTSEASKIWTDYSSSWTNWNSIRALASTASLLMLGLAMYLWGR